jgi:hypothetical protein
MFAVALVLAATAFAALPGAAQARTDTDPCPPGA